MVAAVHQGEESFLAGLRQEAGHPLEKLNGCSSLSF
jgi:hypothetical protein